MEPSKFNYGSVNYCYYQFGEGSKHVLVLHGWGSKISSWNRFFELADKSNFTYYFVEMPGFGDSPNPPAEWGVDDYKEFIQSFIKSQQESIQYLLVHSFGGRVAIKLLNEPHGFLKAIFVGAAGVKPRLPFHKRLVKKISPIFKSIAKSNFIKRILYKLLGATDYANAQGTMKGTFIKVIDEDLTGLLPNINIPIQLVWGKRDSYTPLSMAKKMNQLIPDSKLIILKGARHGVHMQTPQKLASITSEFFNS
jgi:pimeloyl-ACP methyl ester carboxylesterase